MELWQTFNSIKDCKFDRSRRENEEGVLQLRKQITANWRKMGEAGRR